MKERALLLALLLGGCAGDAASAPALVPAPAAPGLDWRARATPADRTRLREWRTAWTLALDEARGLREGAAAIAADPALFDPDRALARPLPPTGAYRCRTLKLGRRGPTGLAWVAYGWFRCRIDGTAFAKLDGSQRPGGALYPDTNARAVLLGTLTLGDETRAFRYGQDARRDVAGVVERIGDARWRIAFPYPAFESKLDLIELRPG